jgi:sec-independent protein translocase protein TatA
MPLFGMPSMWEMLIVLGIVVLLFGAKKLPALGGAFGESIKNFKKGVKDAKPKAIEDDPPPKDESDPNQPS